jgi:transposase
MSEALTVTTERVDDLPLLIGHMRRMELPSLLEQSFHQHGNWQGLSVGWVTTIWLAHLLSEADHRLNHVQPWAEQRLTTLQHCTHQPVRGLDLTDDRLASVLRLLSDDAYWPAFERALTRTLVRVYDLRPRRVRVDSTTASGYWRVTADGLFQFGHSQDRRPDLPQLKVVLATLDPLGLPVASEVVAGHRADDPLYLPAIQRVRGALGQRGLLYVGDCKMASLATRAGVAFHRDYYLCPLPAVQLPPAALAAEVAAVSRGEQAVVPIERAEADGTLTHLADGFERTLVLTSTHDTWPITWSERRLFVRSLALARTAEQALRQRVTKAQTALAALTDRGRGKRRLPDGAAVQQAAAAILTRYQVADLLHVTVHDRVDERPVRGYRDRPGRVERATQVRLTVAVDQAAQAQAVQQAGWRVYATNQPAEQLPLTQAVLAYRDEYLVERSLGRLKGHPLSLRPLYLARDDHATGLVRLLTIALRVLTLLEGAARRRLAAEGTALAGLYAGQPTRATTRPTAERLLASFQPITLTLVQLPGQLVRHLTPLTPLQARILTLLECDPATYLSLTADSGLPP